MFTDYNKPQEQTLRIKKILFCLHLRVIAELYFHKWFLCPSLDPVMQINYKYFALKFPFTGPYNAIVNDIL